MPENEVTDLSLAVDLCEEHFSRTINYPRDSKRMTLLAEDLMRASRVTGISMSAIAARWAETSDKCPTYHNLLVAGEGIRGPIPDPLPKLDERERIAPAELGKLLNGIDMKAVAAKHEQHRREHKAVLAEARRGNDERRHMPDWKLSAVLKSREIAEIRKRLGFELTRSDRENLG